MERFAFKIDKVLRANLYKICRLCGIDNPDKVPILKENETEVVDVDAEPELSQKIQDCVGFLISKDDKMPQMICSLCVDKINDFYEFREMCFATNIQTRKLLGLKDPPKKNVEIKVEVKTEPPPSVADRRGRKRKSEDIPVEAEVKVENEKQKTAPNSNLSKKRARLGFLKEEKKLKKNPVAEPEQVKAEIKNELPVETVPAVPAGNKNLKEICKICNERFGSKYKLDRHKFLSHSPNIPRYVCTTCDETLKKNCEIKSHQLWHKLTKTPYTCALCRETTSSINLYTRHMREHAQKLATPLVVLDRECAQCHFTFCTNFLYNTHSCAVRTRKCGGCNRQIKNEVDYQRHASTCDKAYLMISKHLSSALEPVRIKNENDVEAAAESLSISAMLPTSDAAPTTSNVVESNLSGSNVTQTNKHIKKGSKKGISKKDLKRVDDLLKSTMDALVSIKHEPEMHVDSDVPNHAEQPDNNLTGEVEDVALHAFDDDDFQNRDDFSDDGDNDLFVPIVQLHTGNDIVVKQEHTDNVDQEKTSTSKSVNVVTIKKELPDSGYEDSSATGLIAKVPVLKLKITKEHGTLNSSLVNESPMSREKKKKKKKRKDVDKINDQIDHNENPQKSPLHTPEVSPTKSSDQLSMPLPGIIRIKQERLDNDYPDEVTANETQDVPNTNDTDELMHPEATVMTSIPMMQFQIACVTSGVDFNETAGEKEDQQDIKPNRAELDRWLEINSSTATTQDSEPESGDEVRRTEGINIPNMPKPKQNRSQNLKKNVCRSKALKSTGGISRQDRSVQEMPKIVAVSSGFDAIAAHNDKSAYSHNFAIPNVVVKAEPCDDGYENSSPADESMNSDHEMETSLPFDDSLHKSHQNDDADNDEQAYINSIDFGNICIKQEKDIDVSEPQLTAQNVPANLYNRAEDIVMESITTPCNSVEQTESLDTTCKVTEDTEDDDEVDDEDEEMEHDEEDENSEREYRELEWPPPLIEPKKEIVENNPMSLGLVISSVCSHAGENLADKQKSKNSILSDNQSENINESNVEEGMEGDVPILAGTSISTESRIENKLSTLIEQKQPESGITEDAFSNFIHSEDGLDNIDEVHKTAEEGALTEIHHLSILENTLPSNDFPRSNTEESHTSAEQGITTDIPILKGASISIGSFMSLENQNATLNEQKEQESGITDGAVTTMNLNIVEDAENLIETSPCSKSIDNESNIQTNLTMENIDEEQQNILNQVLANSEIQANNEIPSLNQLTIPPPDILATVTQINFNTGFENSLPSTQSSEQPSAEKNTSSAMLSDCNEETDNFFNENVDAADHRRLPEQEAMHCIPVAFNAPNLQQQRALLLDDSNINEIAENNNNANIERELLDDNSNNAERISPPLTVEQENNNDEVT